MGVKTKTVSVKGGLSFYGTGQVGYDAGGGGSWTVSTGGSMALDGAHALGSNVLVQGSFYASRILSVTGASLTHVGAANPGAWNLKTFVVDGGSLTVLADQSFSLAGVLFNQVGASTTIINQDASFTVGDNTAYADGSTASAKNINVGGGTVKMYPSSRLTTANGDIRFNSSNLDIYSPAYWQLSGVGYIGSVIASAGGTNRSLTFAGSAHINFNDYTPTGATDVVQGGVIFYSYGSLFFADTTAISQRVADNFRVGQNCSINSSCTLTISGTPPPGSRSFAWSEIYCEAGNLTGTFASISNPPPGWQWAHASPEYGNNYLSLAWEGHALNGTSRSQGDSSTMLPEKSSRKRN